MLTVFLNNTSPSLSDTININQVPVDLTGATVALSLRDPNTGLLKIDHAAVVVTDDINGGVRYDWLAGDTDTATAYDAWWTITFPSTKVQDTPEFDVEVLAHAEVSGDLATVAEVRSAMNLPQIATGSDDQIRAYIIEASAQITKQYGRQFAPPVANATHTFTVTGGRCDFYPYDLRSATSVVLHPESYQNTLSPTNFDYQLRPVTPAPEENVYTSMLISPWIAMISQLSMRYGKPQVAVTGAWGFASVPENVKRACIITVRSWLRRDTQSYSNMAQYQPSDLQPVPVGTYSLPYAACALLAPYRRWAGVL